MSLNLNHFSSYDKLLDIDDKIDKINIGKKQEDKNELTPRINENQKHDDSFFKENDKDINIERRNFDLKSYPLAQEKDTTIKPRDFGKTKI